VDFPTPCKPKNEALRDTMSKITLTEVPARINATGLNISYHRIWRAAIEGRFPTERNGKRLFVNVEDLPKVLDVFAPTTGKW
jgi:hypothetical protein